MQTAPTASPKTVLITGCSSGYGLETAHYFHSQGWNVIATMRTPREDLLLRSPRMRIMALDVTRPDSIAAAIQNAGPIDVLVNNAGIGLFGAFEATTFGTMAMAQAVLPQMRARQSGVIVNVTSSATLAAFPLVAAYTASKTAVEGFTASLALELAAFRVQVKLVEPGYAPSTRFTDNGQARMQGLLTEPYLPFAQQCFAAFGQLAEVTQESDVAQAVWNAAHDTTGTLHYPAGADAVALVGTRQ
jgi:NAD(P)-dependent dehydrogenase (short-subunit alcohol dehydrogenase family)